MDILINFDLYLYFEIANAEVFGGAGSVGYTRVKIGAAQFNSFENFLSNEKAYNAFVAEQCARMAENLSLTPDDVRLISREEYLEKSGDDDEEGR